MNWRLVAGFLFAPLLPCVIMVAPGMIEHPEWTGAWLLLGYMVLVSQAISFLVAMPVFYGIRYFREVGLMECVSAGAIFGAIACFAAVLSAIGGNYSASDSGGPTVIHGQYTAHGWVRNAVAVGTIALLGAAIGLVFWLIALWSPKGSSARDA